MALITCPECKKQISEYAENCPNCGYPILSNEPSKHDPQKVEVTSINLFNRNSVRIRMILGGVLIFALIIAAIAFQNAYKARQIRNLYIINLNSISSAMVDGSNEAEKLCNLISKVWRNTIYKEYDSETAKYTNLSNGQYYSDFNTSINNLFEDQITKIKVQLIELTQSRASSLMKELKNPSPEFEKCYNTLNELFSIFMGLTDLATKPNGSLQTYTQNKTEKVEKFMEFYRKFNLQIPEKDK